MVYRTFDFPGLMLLPLLCGLGTLWAMNRTVRWLGLRSRPLVLLALALATPLLLYSLAQMLLAVLAGFWMLQAVQESSLKAAAFAGAMLGLGV